MNISFTSKTKRIQCTEKELSPGYYYGYARGYYPKQTGGERFIVRTHDGLWFIGPDGPWGGGLGDGTDLVDVVRVDITDINLTEV